MKEVPTHVVYVEGWVRRGNEILLAQRSSKDDNEPGVWAPAGGKVDQEVEDDIIEKTLVRELQEELSVEIGNPVFVDSGMFVRSSGHTVVRITFLVDYVSGEPAISEEHDAFGWFDIDTVHETVPKYYHDVIKKIKARM